jgi:hypothetical protein
MIGPRVKVNQMRQHANDVERLLLHAVVILFALAVTLAAVAV